MQSRELSDKMLSGLTPGEINEAAALMRRIRAHGAGIGKVRPARR